MSRMECFELNKIKMIDIGKFIMAGKKLRSIFLIFIILLY